MLKFLIILILIGYVFYRATSFLFSGFLKGFNQGYNPSDINKRTSKPKEGNVHIDSVPDTYSEKTQKNGGGEYVDYEEVK